MSYKPVTLVETPCLSNGKIGLTFLSKECCIPSPSVIYFGIALFFSILNIFKLTLEQFHKHTGNGVYELPCELTLIIMHRKSTTSLKFGPFVQYSNRDELFLRGIFYYIKCLIWTK